MSHLKLPSPRALNHYSSKKMLKPVAFSLLAPEARSVHLLGDFNDWDPEACPLRRHFDGGWHARVRLPHGHHHYQFLVDGKPVLDPNAQGVARNEQGQKVSMIAVS